MKIAKLIFGLEQRILIGFHLVCATAKGELKDI